MAQWVWPCAVLCYDDATLQRAEERAPFYFKTLYRSMWKFPTVRFPPLFLRCKYNFENTKINKYACVHATTNPIKVMPGAFAVNQSQMLNGLGMSFVSAQLGRLLLLLLLHLKNKNNNNSLLEQSERWMRWLESTGQWTSSSQRRRKLLLAQCAAYCARLLRWWGQTNHLARFGSTRGDYNDSRTQLVQACAIHWTLLHIKGISLNKKKKKKTRLTAQITLTPTSVCANIQQLTQQRDSILFSFSFREGFFIISYSIGKCESENASSRFCLQINPCANKWMDSSSSGGSSSSRIRLEEKVRILKHCALHSKQRKEFDPVGIKLIRVDSLCCLALLRE